MKKIHILESTLRYLLEMDKLCLKVYGFMTFNM